MLKKIITIIIFVSFFSMTISTTAYAELITTQAKLHHQQQTFWDKYKYWFIGGTVILIGTGSYLYYNDSFSSQKFNNEKLKFADISNKRDKPKLYTYIKDDIQMSIINCNQYIDFNGRRHNFLKYKVVCRIPENSFPQFVLSEAIIDEVIFDAGIQPTKELLFKVLPDQYVKETYKKSSRAYLNITIPVPIRDAKYIKLLKGKCKAIYGNEYIEESFKNEDNKFEKILKIYSHEISINDMSIGSKGLFTNISFIAKRTDFSIKPRIRDYKIKILLNNGNEIIKKIGYTSEKNNQITFDKDLSKDNILFRNVKDIKIIYFNLSNSKDIKFEFKNIKLH